MFTFTYYISIQPSIRNVLYVLIAIQSYKKPQYFFKFISRNVSQKLSVIFCSNSIVEQRTFQFATKLLFGRTKKNNKYNRKSGVSDQIIHQQALKTMWPISVCIRNLLFTPTKKSQTLTRVTNQEINIVRQYQECFQL